MPITPQEAAVGKEIYLQNEIAHAEREIDKQLGRGVYHYTVKNIPDHLIKDVIDALIKNYNSVGWEVKHRLQHLFFSPMKGWKR